MVEVREAGSGGFPGRLCCFKGRQWLGTNKGKDKSNSRSLRDDKQKNKQRQKQMRGFFAALRMTAFSERAIREGDGSSGIRGERRIGKGFGCR
jgi:hypothetical protein